MIPRPACRAVIFDLDGVLVWSAPVHWEAFRKTFAEKGRAFPYEEYLSFAIGAPREEVIRNVLGELPEPEMRHLMDAKERHVRDHLEAHGIDAIPGSLEFVGKVRARKVKTAVASASRTPELLLESVKAISLFDVIVGRHKVERSKPHPDLYLLTSKLLGVPPPECIVIEDSPVGVEAALRAGMRVVAITTTEPAAKLAGAEGVYEGFAEIPLEDWLS